MTIVIFFAFVFSVADFFQCVNFILNNTFSQLSFELFPKLHYIVNQSICLYNFAGFFLPVMPVIKPIIRFQFVQPQHILTMQHTVPVLLPLE